MRKRDLGRSKIDLLMSKIDLFTLAYLSAGEIQFLGLFWLLTRSLLATY